MRDIDKKLFAAAANNNLSELNMALSEGADINARAEKGLGFSSDSWTALMTASSNNNIDIACSLIERGADLTLKNSNDMTILHFACSRGQFKLVKLCIEKGLDVNQKDDDGITPLMKASGVKKDGTSEQDYLAIIKLLIDNGANVNAKNNDGKTPLYSASSDHLTSRMLLLIQNGADVNSRENDGWTPIFAAINDEYNQQSIISTIKILIDNGGDVNLVDFENGCNAAQLAHELDLNDVVSYLKPLLVSKPNSSINTDSNTATSAESKKAGCFIATACYDSYDASEVLVLRKFRDQFLLNDKIGKAFVSFYYTISPPVANFISARDALKMFVRTLLVAPAVKLVRWWMSRRKADICKKCTFM